MVAVVFDQRRALGNSLFSSKALETLEVDL